MGSRQEVFALAFPGHDDREQACEGMRAALRATAERGFARHDRPTQRPFRGVIGWIDRRVFQPDHQIIQVFLDARGQLLALPTSPVFGRKLPEFRAHRIIDLHPPGLVGLYLFYLLFFFNDTATTEIYTLSLHDALPLSPKALTPIMKRLQHRTERLALVRSEEHTSELQSRRDLVCRLLLEKKKKKK